MVLLSVSFGLAAAPTARGQTPNFKVSVHGGEEKSFDPPADNQIVKESELFDTVIVGAGLAGLSAGVYLTDHHKKVLLLEKEEALGGLALGAAVGHGIKYDRGAAYWTDTFPEEEQILRHIGLGNFRKQYAIHEPADSYFWKGQLYLGIWEEQTLEKLPTSFSVFKFMLKRANDKGQIPNQPFEDAADLSLDELSAADWVRIMPIRLREEGEHGNAEAKKLYEKYERDPRVNHADAMGDVLALLDLYCRSALGAKPDQVSAVAFANFYISEIETRYTTTTGTAGAAERMEKLLRDRGKIAVIRTKATVTRIQNFEDHVVVSYNKDGESHQVEAKYAVFSAQLRLAPKIIEGLEGTEQGDYMAGLTYAHYSVHAVFVKGHPYRATYDTWVNGDEYTDADRVRHEKDCADDPKSKKCIGDAFTDVILGRWMDPRIKGYEGMRTFKKNPHDDDGIMTIYHPLPASEVGQGYDDETAREFAERAVQRMVDLWPPALGKKKLGRKIVVKSVETNRWPFSVHVARPGHFKRVKVMRRPFKRVFFANNNLGTPAFEEALYRGHCAADRVLLALDPGFAFEKWTKCPLPDADQ